MTRDELYHALNDAISRPGWDTIKLMEHIDAYAATERHEIEQQITSHVETRLAAERERIARAIPEAVASRVTWGDEEFISVADVDRIVRGGRADS